MDEEREVEARDPNPENTIEDVTEDMSEEDQEEVRRALAEEFGGG